MNKENMKFDFVKNINSKFDTLSERLNGSLQLSSFENRKSAIENFLKSGIPTSKDENWKYTSLDFLKNYEFQPAFDFSGTEINRENIEKYFIGADKSNVLVFINGIFQKEFSKINKYDIPGLFIGNLKEAVEFSNEYTQIIHQNIIDDKDAFVNLNEAFFLDGAFIHLPADYVLEDSVHILMFADANKDNLSVNQKNIIVAGTSSNIKVIENAHILGDNVAFLNNITLIYALESSSVNYIKYQNDEGNLYNIGHTYIEQKDKSKFFSNVVTLKSKFVHNSLNVKHNGENSETNLFGLYFLDGNDFADNHTLIDHAKPKNLSNETYKGILNGHAHAVFDGRILVRPDAQHTESYQSNKNILLSNDATINTKPQLEIYADDVKCSHGATSGSIDDEALFYLRARALDETKAKAFLLDAFAKEIINKIHIEELRILLKKHIQNRLGIDHFDICHMINN